jgi:type II secretory pathway pseudopilin PulG
MRRKTRYRPRPACRSAFGRIAVLRGSPGARGLTLLEIIVAMALTLAILGAVVGTFVQVLRVSRNSEIRLNAVANARTALETLSGEIKAVTRVPDFTFFVGTNAPLAYGDGKDNDADGRVDEELPNGLDDDGDWTAAGDQHALFVFRRERAAQVGKPDLGDKGVDEDNRFNLDQLSFRQAVPDNPLFAYEDVHYEVTAFEDKSRVLVRRSDKLSIQTGLFETSIAPLAYNVLSFNLLYWNPNAQPASQYWVETWDSSTPTRAPGFDLPAAVLVQITVYADPGEIDRYQPGQPVETETLQTIVNVENVIQDAAFPRVP